MAEFDVTLSAMADAVSNIRNYTEQFKEEADQVYQAAQKLSESWSGDSSQDFAANMEQLHNWMQQMAETLATYSEALSKARDKYEEADVSAAKNF